MTSEELLNQALKALESDNGFEMDNAAEAIRARLAHPGQESISWTHDCAVLLTNDIELWIDKCPHCGKPKTVPLQQPAACNCNQGQVCHVCDPHSHTTQPMKQEHETKAIVWPEGIVWRQGTFGPLYTAPQRLTLTDEQEKEEFEKRWAVLEDCRMVHKRMKEWSWWAWQARAKLEKDQNEKSSLE